MGVAFSKGVVRDANTPYAAYARNALSAKVQEYTYKYHTTGTGQYNAVVYALNYCAEVICSPPANEPNPKYPVEFCELAFVYRVMRALKAYNMSLAPGQQGYFSVDAWDVLRSFPPLTVYSLLQLEKFGTAPRRGFNPWYQSALPGGAPWPTDILQIDDVQLLYSQGFAFQNGVVMLMRETANPQSLGRVLMVKTRAAKGFTESATKQYAQPFSNQRPLNLGFPGGKVDFPSRGELGDRDAVSAARREFSEEVDGLNISELFARSRPPWGTLQGEGASQNYRRTMAMVVLNSSTLGVVGWVPQTLLTEAGGQTFLARFNRKSQVLPCLTWRDMVSIRGTEEIHLLNPEKEAAAWMDVAALRQDMFGERYESSSFSRLYGHIVRLIPFLV